MSTTPLLEGEKPASSTMPDSDMKAKSVDRILVTTTSRKTFAEDPKGPRKVDLTVVYFRLKKTKPYATTFGIQSKYFALEQPHTAPLNEDEKKFFRDGGEPPKIDEKVANRLLQEGIVPFRELIPYKVQEPYFTGKKMLIELGRVKAEYTITDIAKNLDPVKKAERDTFKYIEDNVIQKLNKELVSGEERFKPESLSRDWFERLKLLLENENFLLNRE